MAKKEFEGKRPLLQIRKTFEEKNGKLFKVLPANEKQSLT